MMRLNETAFAIAIAMLESKSAPILRNLLILQSALANFADVR